MPNTASPAATGRSGGSHAHHIVAENDARAEPAREILRLAGMHINDAHNGMFLPAYKHAPIHTETYYAAVNTALASAVGYRDVANRLFQISAQIELGKFPR